VTACLAFLFAAVLLIVQTVQPRIAFLLLTMLMVGRLLSQALFGSIGGARVEA
jgi:hypothetical protein